MSGYFLFVEGARRLGMAEIPKDKYDYWVKEAEEYLTHDPQGLCRPFCSALRDAIFTLQQRDAEIAALKNAK
jgi:hypothetical protein